MPSYCKCGKLKTRENTYYYTKDNRFYSKCRECRKKYYRDYYSLHRNEISEAKKIYYYTGVFHLKIKEKPKPLSDFEKVKQLADEVFLNVPRLLINRNSLTKQIANNY
jgi:hypothetical protein